MRHIDAIKIYQRKRCLIIDDMSEVRGSLQRMLVSFGIASIDTAANGEQAMEMCRQTSYDLVLCDYNLGDGQDGQQVLEALRFSKLLKNTSLFLMITAETSTDMVLGALEYLPDDYLSKPITQSLLQTRLNRIVLRHEDLLPIKQAIDDDKLELAIQLCQQKLDSGSKYSSQCLRIQAELLFRLGKYSEAGAIYEQCLQSHNPVWAQLGLGKTRLAQQRYSDAEALLQQVIEFDQRYVDAHDLLAQLYSEQADYPQAQAALMKAVEVSPKSVLRLRRLANMAQITNDREVRIKARRSALKVGEHSCYYSPQDYFDVAADLLDSGNTQDREGRWQSSKELKDAQMYIQRAEKKHPQDISIRTQAAAAKARLASQKQKTDEAANWLAKAKELSSGTSCSGLAELEIAQAMLACGDRDGATAQLLKVVRENPDDEELADRVDALSDEPVSDKGRRLAAELTRSGIKYYESKDYDAAMREFQRAISLFPKHISLRLNIAQAALAKAAASSATEAGANACRQHLQAIKDISAEHPQYPRYQHLLKQAQKYFGVAAKDLAGSIE